jgi:hypothetical protein
MGMIMDAPPSYYWYRQNQGWVLKSKYFPFDGLYFDRRPIIFEEMTRADIFCSVALRFA